MHKTTLADGKALLANPMGQIVAVSTFRGGERELSFSCIHLPAGVYTLMIGNLRSQLVVMR